MQSISWLIAGLFATASLTISSTIVTAHENLTIGDVEVTSHLEPDDSPYAGEPSFTWFHLTRSDGESIALADCSCRLVVYNSQNEAIFYPQLTETEVEGHERPITTTITFPNSGNYRLVLTGQPIAGRFEPFEITIPVTVRP